MTLWTRLFRWRSTASESAPSPLDRSSEVAEGVKAKLPIDRCQVRGCSMAAGLGFVWVDSIRVQLCKQHNNILNPIRGKAPKLQLDQVVLIKELEAETINPHPLIAADLEGRKFEKIKGYYERIERPCPGCGLKIAVDSLDLMKDLVGIASTTINGSQVLPGVVVCCGECITFLRARPTAAIRRHESDNPIKGFSFESLGTIKPRCYYETFPFGCPDCHEKKGAKQLEIRVAEFTRNSSPWPEQLWSRYICTNCGSNWTLHYESVRKSHISFSRDGSHFSVADWKKCGTLRSSYVGTVSGSGGHWTKCHSCGDYLTEWE